MRHIQFADVQRDYDIDPDDLEPNGAWYKSLIRVRLQ